MRVDRNEDVMEMVEETLLKNPAASTKELKEKAEDIDEGIAELSPRQFNARYPLQVKRQLKAEKEEEETGREQAEDKPATNEDEFRATIREVLLDFARAVAGAEGAEMIDVLGSVEEYVDRVLEAG